MLGTILIVMLILALLGAMPRWPHSRQWGYVPTGGRLRSRRRGHSCAPRADLEFVPVVPGQARRIQLFDRGLLSPFRTRAASDRLEDSDG